MPTFDLQGLDHVALSVTDTRRSAAFYEEVLGLQRQGAGWADPIFMLAPDRTGLALFTVDSQPAAGDGSGQPGARFLHLAFRVERAAFDAARAELAERGVEVRFMEHRFSHSIYFADPDGHRLELTTYEI